MRLDVRGLSQFALDDTLDDIEQMKIALADATERLQREAMRRKREAIIESCRDEPEFVLY